MKKITSCVCSLVCIGALHLTAADSVKTDVVRENLSHVAAAELPAKAADLIKQAKSSARSATTIQVVKAALDINPAAAPAIVGAIARAVPEMAATAAGTAAEQQPRQAAVIARSAAAVAPTKVGKIVAAVCRVVPNDFRNIAMAVSQVVPGAGKEILEAIASAIPDLKSLIAQTLAANKGNVVSVADALDKPSMNLPDPSKSLPSPDLNSPLSPITRSARGPAVGPPYIPLSGTPGNVNPGNSGEVPTGGRGYATP